MNVGPDEHKKTDERMLFSYSEYGVQIRRKVQVARGQFLYSCSKPLRERNYLYQVKAC
jgi:hypothetical protein